MSEFKPRNRESASQRAIDEALDFAMAQGPPKPVEETALKRQWDADLEAELEAALEGFDASKYEIETPRTRAGDRKHVPKSDRGQEGTPGPRQGKVISIRGKSVFVDLGAKSEGVVPVEQFEDKIPSPGDMIDVTIDRFDADEGILLLSLKGAAVEATWENLRKGIIVEARVTKTNKGGLDVEVGGIRGFLPVGQIDINRVEDPSEYVNQKLRVVVTEANQRERNLVVSRRELLEQERAEKREKTWAELQEGQVRDGVIRTIKPYGAFVDIGGVDGLLPVSEMSWSRVADAASFVKSGQEVQVKVLKIDRENRKVSLGLKQLTPSPWDLVEDKYERGMTVKGKVTRLMDFGAFVELEPGVEGLIHISELSPNRVRRAADIVKPEQEVEVRILKIEPEARKIALSLRPLPVVVKEEPEEEEDDTPPAPKPERKVPLKGGLGDQDRTPFGKA
ncbi:MAG: S1 RNA-binding domain-containing protein [Isosphaeraceae bacterium]|nr:S1 RNA-binding domain-containing protein [Isosphaeraceae bacterium]